MQTVLIPLAKIRVGRRLRPLNEGWAEVLAGSMRERAGNNRPVMGQLKPIEVGPLDSEGMHELIDGRHRLAALELIGAEGAWAIVRDVTDGERRLLEIDEQLIHQGLSAFSRAAFLAERKTIYLDLHPETKKGGKGGRGGRKTFLDQGDKLNAIMAVNFLPFSEDAAAKVGLHKDTVSDLVGMYGRLADDSKARIPGSPIEDRRMDLDLLSRQAPERQAEILDLILQEEDPARTVAEAIGRLDGHAKADGEEKAMQRLVERWRRMNKPQRRAWVMLLGRDEAEELARLIDKQYGRVGRLSTSTGWTAAISSPPSHGRPPASPTRPRAASSASSASARSRPSSRPSPPSSAWTRWSGPACTRGPPARRPRRRPLPGRPPWSRGISRRSRIRSATPSGPARRRPARWSIRDSRPPRARPRSTRIGSTRRFGPASP